MPDSSDAAIRQKLEALAKALRKYHKALLDVAREDYEFTHGRIESPYLLYSLVTNDPAFQWLRPLSGLMSTLDEVIDTKNTTLGKKNLSDVKAALHLLFAETDPRFAEFRNGYQRAKTNLKVRETEASWRRLLDSLEA